MVGAVARNTYLDCYGYVNACQNTDTHSHAYAHPHLDPGSNAAYAGTDARFARRVGASRVLPGGLGPAGSEQWTCPKPALGTVLCQQKVGRTCAGLVDRWNGPWPGTRVPSGRSVHIQWLRVSTRPTLDITRAMPYTSPALHGLR